MIFSVRQIKTELEERTSRLEDLVSDLASSWHHLERVEGSLSSLLREQGEEVNNKDTEILELRDKIRQD